MTRQANGPRTVPAPAQAGRSGPPRPVAIAAWLMYTGAGLTAVSLVLTFVTIGAVRSSAHRSHPHWAPARVDGYVHAQVAVSVILIAIELALWLLVAWACRTGRGWGRLLGTGLFILNTLLFVAGIASAGIAVALTMSSVIWLLGLATIVLLWQRPSSGYFAAEPSA